MPRMSPAENRISGRSGTFMMKCIKNMKGIATGQENVWQENYGQLVNPENHSLADPFSCQNELKLGRDKMIFQISRIWTMSI